MRTVVVDPESKEMAELIERRRAIGADRFDEVWEGEYHMAPAPSAAHALLDYELAVVLGPLARVQGLVGTTAFNLGSADDYRVPDAGFHRSPPTGSWVPAAVLVVEVLSPHDESWNKLGFYASRGVQEVVIADPQTSVLTWLALDGDGASFVAVDRSELLQVTVAEVSAAINWPSAE